MIYNNSLQRIENVETGHAGDLKRKYWSLSLSKCQCLRWYPSTSSGTNLVVKHSPIPRINKIFISSESEYDLRLYNQCFVYFSRTE